MSVDNWDDSLLKLTDSRTKDPWVVQVTLSSFDQENLKVVIEIGQTEYSQCLLVHTLDQRNKPASYNTSTTTSTTHDDINLIRDRHDVLNRKIFSI